MPTHTPSMASALHALPDYLRRLAPEQGVWIDGTGHPSSTATTFDIINPATAQSVATISDGSIDDGAAAVTSAQTALPAWAATSPRARADILRRSYEAMCADIDTLAALISLENGKSLDDARAEVLYAAEFFRWFGEEAVRTEGAYGSSPAGGTRTIVTHRPVGVAVLVTPWNFPAAMATRKLAPALAAGCTVVLKPASETPLTALAIMQILAGAGVPAGVVNMVPSSQSGALVGSWLADSRVRKISFTGSTQVGRILLAQAAERVVNTSMELGGNASFIVAADADLDEAVDGAMVAKLRNGGQACTAANRFYVHADVVDEFTEKLGARIAALVVGPADLPGAQIGPMINRRALDSMTALVDQAVSDGARISHQAATPEPGEGFFFPPTVLRDVAPDASILNVEIFGPIVTIVTWTDRDQLLAMVNGTEFGLASYVFSRDLGWALCLAEAMEAGMVGINRGAVSDPAAPFGGVKQSGIGREGAREGLREFEETQYFSVAWPY